MTGSVQFTGGPTFSNVMTTTGTDSNGNQMLTATATAVPTGSGVYSAIYEGDSNYALASSNNVFVNVTIPDFTVGPQAGLSVVPTAGQPGSGQIMIAPVSMTQAPSTVTLSLASGTAIYGYQISLTPQQVNLNGSATSATLTLTPANGVFPTVIRSNARRAGIFGVAPHRWWSVSLLTGVVAIFVLCIPSRRKRWREALGLSVTCLLLFAFGCGGGGGAGGGGGGGGGTPPGPSSIALATSNAKVALGAPFTITATVTGSNPSGTVTFSDSGTPIAGAFTLVGGQAQIGAGSLNAIGIHQITATYNGDAHNLGSISTAVNQTLTGTVPITIQGSTGSDVHSIQATLGVQ